MEDHRGGVRGSSVIAEVRLRRTTKARRLRILDAASGYPAGVLPCRSIVTQSSCAHCIALARALLVRFRARTVSDYG